MPPRHHLRKRLHRRLRNQPRRNKEFVHKTTNVTLPWHRCAVRCKCGWGFIAGFDRRTLLQSCSHFCSASKQSECVVSCVGVTLWEDSCPDAPMYRSTLLARLIQSTIFKTHPPANNDLRTKPSFLTLSIEVHISVIDSIEYRTSSWQSPATAR